MAYKTVADLKSSVQGMLTGINLNNVVNLFTAFERTARVLATKAWLPESMGKAAITLYDGVVDYAAPTDIFGSSLVDFRVQGNSRNLNDYTYRVPIEVFDRTKALLPNGTELAFEFVKGIGRVRIVSTTSTPKIELDSMTETTGWTAAGSAGSLTADETVYWNMPASLRFTLTGASTGTLTKTISQVDLTKYVGVGVVFLAFRTPSASNLTSFSIKIGSTSSLATNYYQVSSVTTGFLGAWTTGEWLLVALDLANATTAGTPVATALKYVQLSIVHAATLTNFYVGGLWIALPSPHDMLYQSAAIFQASGSNPSQGISSVSDSILLTDAPYLIYEKECAIAIAQQQGGTLASGLVLQLMGELNGTGRQPGLYDIYRGMRPSQEIREVGSYYDA